jgi:DNA-binding transcriptional LysR family regulator
VELRHFKYFVAVAETLNYRRAAQAIHISQPALSKQIKDLEEHVGVRLLDRNTGGVVLTDAGAVFLEEARDILERVDMAAKAAREAEAGRSGRLVVGSLGAVSASFLPATLSAFRARFPRIEVNLHEAPTPDQIHALQTGIIQVGFTIDETLARSPGLASMEVFTTRMAVAIGREHPLAASTAISLADLAHETFFYVGGTERQQLHRRLIERIFAARGIRHRPLKRVNGFESLVALVTGGHGVSLLLPFGPAAGRDELVFRRVKEDGDDLFIRLLAVWLNRRSSQLVKNFVDVLRHRVSRAPRASAKALRGSPQRTIR